MAIINLMELKFSYGVKKRPTAVCCTVVIFYVISNYSKRRQKGRMSLATRNDALLPRGENVINNDARLSFFSLFARHAVSLLFLCAVDVMYHNLQDSVSPHHSK